MLGPWTQLEDVLLTKLVNKIGSQKWSEIAKRIKGREGKQCRERWHNHLNPQIRKDPWDEKEEWLLFLVKFQFLKNQKLTKIQDYKSIFHIISSPKYI
jgi:hypothetical protein